MKINGTFMLRMVADEYILVPTGKTAIEFNGLITLNEVGATIWKGIESGYSKDKILSKITDIYNVDLETAIHDLDCFIASLRDDDFIN